MSWSAVRIGLSSFLSGISGVGKVYGHWPRVSVNTDHADFKTAFTTHGKLNFIVFRRTLATSTKSEDDDSSFIRSYEVELEAFFAFSSSGESEHDFQGLLDGISKAAEETIQRTLAGSALTFSVPDWSNIRLIRWYGNPPMVTCHQALGRMTVEAVTSSGVTATTPTIPVIPANLTAKQLAIGNALLEYLQQRLAGMNLAKIDWAPGVNPHPAYPINPRTACPRLLLRAYTDDITPIATQGHSFSLAFSLFYQRIQMPGQRHQEVLMAEMKLIEEALLQRFNPGNTKAAGADFCRPTQMVIHDEMSHPRIDDPGLRVSVGELVIRVDSHDRY